jgi:Ca2+-binding RTX toxin-like protein
VVITCVCAGVLAGSAVPAGAAGVSLVDGRVTVRAGPGETNDLVLEQVGDDLRVVDAGVPPVPGTGCAPVPDVHAAVVCPAAGARVLDVDAGDLDDRVDLRATLPGVVAGGEGGDTLGGGGGDDVLLGGPGDDVVGGARGADVLDGGPGADTVRYDDGLHDAGVAVSLSGGDNDGAFTEGDDVRGVEVVIGGRGPDAVRGTDGPERFEGGPGDDTAELLGGDDTFAGGEGDDSCLLDGLGYDVCDGGPGDDDLAAYRGPLPLFISLDGRANDGRRGATGNVLGVEEVLGGEGPDVLVGGDGPETLSGRGGDDVLRGGGGDDLLSGDRGADTVEGGAGRDRVSFASVFVGGPVRVTLDKRPNDGETAEGDRIGRDVEVLEGTTTGADLLAAGETGATLRGLGGEDRLVGGTGQDLLEGGDGGDLIAALDGVRDEVRCGPGLDLVIADDVDVLRDCEARGRQRPVLRLMGRTPMVLRLRCPRVYRAPVRPYARVCRGTVTVRRGARVLRRLRVSATAGLPRTVRGPAVRRGDDVRWVLDRVRAPVAQVRVGS